MSLIHCSAGDPSVWLGLLADPAFALTGHAETTLTKRGATQLKTAGITIAIARTPRCGRATTNR